MSLKSINSNAKKTDFFLRKFTSGKKINLSLTDVSKSK